MRALKRNPHKLKVSPELQVRLDRALESVPHTKRVMAALTKLSDEEDESEQLNTLRSLWDVAAEGRSTGDVDALHLALDVELKRGKIDLDQLAKMFHIETLDSWLERGTQDYAAWEDMSEEEFAAAEERARDEYEREAIRAWEGDHWKTIESAFERYGLILAPDDPKSVISWEWVIGPKESWEDAAQNFEAWDGWQEDLKEGEQPRYYSARDLVLQELKDVPSEYSLRRRSTKRRR